MARTLDFYKVNESDRSITKVGSVPVSSAITIPRGFALYQASSKLLVLDLESRKPVASVATGRGGVKFGKFMGAVGMSMASAYAGAGIAAATGSP